MLFSCSPWNLYLPYFLLQVATEFAHYRIHIFHFEKNVQEKYKSSTLISLVVEAAYAYTKDDFDYYFHEIQKFDTEVPEYLLKANIKKWLRAYAYPNCYYIMTSNLAETINSMLKLSTRD